MRTARPANPCQEVREAVRPGSSTYQTPIWRRAAASPAPATVRSQSLTSWRARAAPKRGGLTGGGPPARRWRAWPSSQRTV